MSQWHWWIRMGCVLEETLVNESCNTVNGSYNESYDIVKESCNTVNESCDIVSESHDIVNESHDIVNESCKTAKRSYGIANESCDTVTEVSYIWVMSHRGDSTERQKTTEDFSFRYVVTYGNTLTRQHTATHFKYTWTCCNTYCSDRKRLRTSHSGMVQHTATLQHTAAHTVAARSDWGLRILVV